MESKKRLICCRQDRGELSAQCELHIQLTFHSGDKEETSNADPRLISNMQQEGSQSRGRLASCDQQKKTERDEAGEERRQCGLGKAPQPARL